MSENETKSMIFDKSFVNDRVICTFALDLDSTKTDLLRTC